MITAKRNLKETLPCCALGHGRLSLFFSRVFLGTSGGALVHNNYMLAIMRYNITGYTQPLETIRKENRNGINGTKIKDKG
jgi:hypothetical protein